MTTKVTKKIQYFVIEIHGTGRSHMYCSQPAGGTRPVVASLCSDFTFSIINYSQWLQYSKLTRYSMRYSTGFAGQNLCFFTLLSHSMANEAGHAQSLPNCILLSQHGYPYCVLCELYSDRTIVSNLITSHLVDDTSKLCNARKVIFYVFEDLLYCTVSNVQHLPIAYLT